MIIKIKGKSKYDGIYSKRVVKKFVFCKCLPCSEDEYTDYMFKILRPSYVVQIYALGFEGYRWYDHCWATEEEYLEFKKLENKKYEDIYVDDDELDNTIREAKQDLLDKKLATYIVKLARLHTAVEDNEVYSEKKLSEELDILWEELTDKEHLIIQEVARQLIDDYGY